MQCGAQPHRLDVNMMRCIIFLLSFLLDIEVHAEPFTKKNIEKSLFNEILQKTSLNDFDVVLESWQDSWNQDNAKDSLVISDLNIDGDQRKFNATVSCRDIKKRVIGKIKWMTHIPVLNHPLNTNDVISDADITMTHFSSDQIKPGMALKKEELIGRKPRTGRMLKMNMPVSLNDVETPRVVKQGELITISYVDPTFHISSAAVARANGAVGDMINVEVGNKKIIQAMIVRPGHAEIREG